MKNAAALAAVLLAPAAFAATPCDAPEQFVRQAKAISVSAGDTRPLLRPYVIGGVATVAVREAAGVRWLELAVNSTDDARRLLSGRTGEASGPTVDLWQNRVWLRCPQAADRT